MEHKDFSKEDQMPDRPVQVPQPRHIEPIFDASGTLRRIRVERPRTNKETRETEPADRT